MPVFSGSPSTTATIHYPPINLTSTLKVSEMLGEFGLNTLEVITIANKETYSIIHFLHIHTSYRASTISLPRSFIILIRSFVRSFIHSFVHSFVRSFVLPDASVYFSMLQRTTILLSRSFTPHIRYAGCLARLCILLSS
jgi:hypothetical protein